MSFNKVITFEMKLPSWFIKFLILLGNFGQFIIIGPKVGDREGKNGGLRLSPDQMLGGIQKIVPLPIVKSSSYH